MAFNPKLRSPKEEPLFILGLLVSGVAWLALVVSIIGLFYGGIFLLFALAAHALFLAHIKGNGVRVSERQLPELYARVKAASERLGLSPVPEVYLIQHGGVLNAFATKLLSRQFVIIYSDLADQCADPRSLDFVIGHELAHVAAGHLKYRFLLAPFQLVPWLGAAYSRACEYTCDRAGQFVVGDLDASVRGLCVLAAGGKLAPQVDLAAFMEQRQEAGHFWMAVLELVSSHPYLCKRAAALKEFAIPGSVKPVGRNLWAYPLAPLLGIGAAGTAASAPLIMVAVIGMMAAIAIPNFIRFQERARQAAAMQRMMEEHQRDEDSDGDEATPSDDDDATPAADDEAPALKDDAPADGAKPAK